MTVTGNRLYKYCLNDAIFNLKKQFLVRKKNVLKYFKRLKNLYITQYFRPVI